MKTQNSSLLSAVALAATLAFGTAQAADAPAKAPAKTAAKPAAKPAAAKPAAPADVNAEFARVVYQHSKSVHNEQPQALLRAVVVLRVKLDEQNQWKAEVFRENPDQPELTKAALESVAALPAPTGLSPKAMEKLHGEGVIEAWLFQTDGRFALKSLAKPQRSA
jgi:hypothetical protein